MAMTTHHNHLPCVAHVDNLQYLSIGVVTLSRRSENGFPEIEGKEEPIG